MQFNSSSIYWCSSDLIYEVIGIYYWSWNHTLLTLDHSEDFSEKQLLTNLVTFQRTSTTNADLWQPALRLQCFDAIDSSKAGTVANIWICKLLLDIIVWPLATLWATSSYFSPFFFFKVGNTKRNFGRKSGQKRRKWQLVVTLEYNVKLLCLIVLNIAWGKSVPKGVLGELTPVWKCCLCNI